MFFFQSVIHLILTSAYCQWKENNPTEAFQLEPSKWTFSSTLHHCRQHADGMRFHSTLIHQSLNIINENDVYFSVYMQLISNTYFAS